MTFSDTDKAATGTGKGDKGEAAYAMLEACYKGGIKCDCAAPGRSPRTRF